MAEPGNEVEERLESVVDGLMQYGVTGWALKACEVLTAAVRAAVGSHRPVFRGVVVPACNACGLYWPCDTVKDVLAELEEL